MIHQPRFLLGLGGARTGRGQYGGKTPKMVVLDLNLESFGSQIATLTISSRLMFDVPRTVELHGAGYDLIRIALTARGLSLASPGAV
jgi:hypothetical protein